MTRPAGSNLTGRLTLLVLTAMVVGLAGLHRLIGHFRFRRWLVNEDHATELVSGYAAISASLLVLSIFLLIRRRNIGALGLLVGLAGMTYCWLYLLPDLS